MVPVRPTEPPAPPAERVQTFPKSPEGFVRVGSRLIGTVLVKVEIDGQPDEVQAVGYALSRGRISLCRLYITDQLPSGYFEAEATGFVD